MLQTIITYSFYLLFSLTPLIWYSGTSELFEFNKMIWVYLLTTIITTSWILKMIQERSFLLKKTPLDLPILLFLISTILSTIFSIDRHISIFGYYSRSNGGLLSIISYSLLYYALVSNFERKDQSRFLKSLLTGGLIVSLWAIPEHFGLSPSCVILNSEFDANCWVQDVQSRVFATLGQPNWLAAYLGFLIFPATYFAISIKNIKSRLFYFLLTALFYLAFTFTYSRGATLGLIFGILTVISGLTIFYKSENYKDSLRIKNVSFILIIFFIITLTFGSALTSFKLVNKFAPPARESLTTAVQQSSKPSSGTQLENGGTESGQIRLIVWKGAFEIFKHYPILGSGVETFAYSYYQYRPVEHNLVSEWDFLYNKAHNEYLNYLATTGLFGIFSYLFLTLTFIYYAFKKVTKKESLLSIFILASFITNLVQQFFGFSVVITNLFLFIFPALLFLEDDFKNRIFPNQLKLININKSLPRNVLLTSVSLVAIFTLVTIYRMWVADTIYAQGQKANDAGNPGRAYNLLYQSTKLNSNEPLYEIELSLAAAGSAVALQDTDATLSATMKKIADISTDNTLRNHPNNVSLFRTAIRTYYLLSSIDRSFSKKTLETLDKAITLSPTDPKLRYNKALVLDSVEQIDESIQVLEDVIKLKPNYREAHLTLGEEYLKKGFKEKAKLEAEIVLKLIPNDPEALELINKIESKK